MNSRILITVIFGCLHVIICSGESPVYNSKHLAHLKSSILVQTQQSLPTVTVRGFLNFRTTVDGTVIVFTPASASVHNNNEKESANNYRTPTLQTNTPSIQSTQTPSPSFQTKQAVSVSIEPTKVHESFTQVTPTPRPPQYPLGLVTVLGGTVVMNGQTTVYETKVIGTYIDGKYAQILQSTSKINSPSSSSIVIQPSKTISPIIVSSIFGPQIDNIKTSISESKEISLANPKPAKFIDSNAIHSLVKNNNIRSVNAQLRGDNNIRSKLNARFSLLAGQSRWTPSNLQSPSGDDKKGNDTNTISKARRLGTRRFQLPPRQSPRVLLNRFKVKLPRTGKSYKENDDLSTQPSIDRSDKIIQPRIGQSQHNEPEKKQHQVEHLQLQTIEQFEKENPSHQMAVESKPQAVHHHVLLPLETVAVDPAKVVKEVQTITSEVTKHIDGNNIQIQTVTFTTTIDRPLIHPSEFAKDVIQPTIPVEANDLEATSVLETPPLVISRTYSVTERSMRTTVVPVFDGTVTTSHTVTESFFIRKLITAYKTMPPGDLFLLETASMGLGLNDYGNASDLLTNDQNEASILHDAIEVTNIPEDDLAAPTAASMQQTLVQPTIESSINLPGLLPGFQLPNLDMNNPLLLAAALQNPQLAAVYLGLQQLKQQATQYNTITKPTTVISTETIYNTKVVSYYDGRVTRSRTISEPLTTSERTLTTYTTEITPVINGNFALQQAQLQNAFATQLMAPQLQFTPKVTTITRQLTTVTDATSTKTKVYTLVYNAFSTKFRTVTSTSIYPTTITTTITSTIPLSSTFSTQSPQLNLNPNPAPLNFFG